ATRLARAASARCSARRARVAARRPRCPSSPAATSRCTVRRVSSSVVGVMTGPAGAVTRVGVATRWRAANSGDPSDNHVNARQTGPENKLLSRPAGARRLLAGYDERSLQSLVNDLRLLRDEADRNAYEQPSPDALRSYRRVARELAEAETALTLLA